jgi:hypothetical protein
MGPIRSGVSGVIRVGKYWMNSSFMRVAELSYVICKPERGQRQDSMWLDVNNPYMVSRVEMRGCASL